MTIGIYCIENLISNKKYIGKSCNIEHRFWCHKNQLAKIPKPKDCNRYLYNAVQKYKIDNFKFYILECFDTLNENFLKNRELLWIDIYKTYNQNFGYNLRRDSSTNTVVHEETKKLLSIIQNGKDNSNYGNRWNEKQKQHMSIVAKERHASGKYYNKNWKLKISERSKITWQNEILKSKMAKSVSKAKKKYNFYQYSLEGLLIKIWGSVDDIILENPKYKWQNIYSVCNGYKRTYQGFIWKKQLKNII